MARLKKKRDNNILELSTSDYFFLKNVGNALTLLLLVPHFCEIADVPLLPNPVTPAVKRTILKSHQLNIFGFVATSLHLPPLMHLFVS